MGIHYFLISAQKHKLWVLVRTALLFCVKHRLWVLTKAIPTGTRIYVLEQKYENYQN